MNTKYEIDFTCGEYLMHFATTTNRQYAQDIAKMLIKTEGKVRISKVSTKWKPLETLVSENNEIAHSEQTTND